MPLLDLHVDNQAAVRRERVRARHVQPGSPTSLLLTVEALASFGEKRVGTRAGARAAAYLHDRLRGAGLHDVVFEEFAFPRHDVDGAALRVDGANVDIGFDVLEGCGAGAAAGELVAGARSTWTWWRRWRWGNTATCS